MEGPYQIKGIPSGFPSLDEMTGGLRNGDLIVVGSRPYVGKTTFGLDVAINKHGRTGSVQLRFDEDRLSFVDTFTLEE